MTSNLFLLMITVVSIHIYPIKGMRGVSLESSQIDQRGLAYDRRWMVIDGNGKFVTQREQPKLTTIEVEWNEPTITLSLNGKSVTFSHDNVSSEAIRVKVWNDWCEGIIAEEFVNQWLSQALEGDYRLIYMPDDSRRVVNPKYVPQEAITSFTDGYPFLVISEASLEYLNDRLETPVGMERFRPNLVIRGVAAHIEDNFEKIKIGDIPFEGAKRCPRCQVPTIDQKTGEKGRQPMLTLARYRLFDEDILFGMNMVHRGQGVIKVGDILERQD